MNSWPLVCGDYQPEKRKAHRTGEENKGGGAEAVKYGIRQLISDKRFFMRSNHSDNTSLYDESSGH